MGLTISSTQSNNLSIQRQIQANENKISKIDKEIAGKEKLMAMEQDILNSEKELLNDLIESRNLQKNHIDTLIESRDLDNKRISLLESNISIIGKIIDAAKALLNIKLKEAASFSNPSNGIPQVLTQQSSITNTEQFSNLIDITVQREIARYPESDHNKLKEAAQQVVAKSLDENNMLKKDINLVKELDAAFSKISYKLEDYTGNNFFKRWGISPQSIKAYNSGFR